MKPTSGHLLLEGSSRDRFGSRPGTIAAFVVFFAVVLGLGFWQIDSNGYRVQWLQVGLIVVLMGLTLLETRRTNRSLKYLASVADSIGEGNYAERAALQTRDALGAMARSINRMADGIGKASEEKEAALADLAKSSEELNVRNGELSEAVARQSRFGSYLTSLATIDISALATNALGQIMEAARAPLGAFYLYDAEAKNAVCLAAQGLDREALGQLTGQTATQGLPMEVLHRHKWLFLDDLPADALPLANTGLGVIRLNVIYGIPLIFRDAPLGSLILAAPRLPDVSVIEYLQNHVEALVNALNNALSYKAISHQTVLLEQANQALVKADRLRGEFIRTMSHELRTPLNSIIGFSGLLLKNRDGTLGTDSLRKVEKIHRNGTNLLDLINEILDLSKIEAGKMEVQHIDTDLARVVHEVVDLLQPQAEAKGLQLSASMVKAPPRLLSDEQRVRQILINLVGNAIKFTPNGSVRVEVSAEARHVLVRVVDTGIGIAEAQLATIFEAFRQADNSTTREYGGTGLGLTISKSFAELLGGTIQVESRLGQGSTFTLSLPAGQNAPVSEPSHAFRRAPAAPEAGAPTTRFEEVMASGPAEIRAGQHVLIVDDDDDARDLIAQYVQELGAHPIPCASAAQAMALARSETPDLITLDLMLPEKSGWDVLAALKADPHLQPIPILIISIVADRNRAINCGAVDALQKPITRGDFDAVLRRALGRKFSRALVADDDPDARQLMKERVEEHGATVRTAANGQEAWEALSEFDPDILFLDLQMPVLDGRALLSRVRQDPRYVNLPVVVVTGLDLDAPERRDLEQRSTRILEKKELFACHR